MKNIIICTITALALAGCIAEPSVALDEPAPETVAAPVAEEESPAPEATDAPVGEDEGGLSEAEPAELEETVEEVKRDSVIEGLICVKEGWAEACRAPDLIDLGLAPLPDGTPATVVTEEPVQELKTVKAKRPGVPKTGY